MADPIIERVRETMERRGFTRADLARLLSLDSSQVTRIFKGERRIQVHEMRSIEEWLGWSPSEGGQILPMRGMVPLYGVVGAASGSHLAVAEQSLLGYVPMHPNQVNLRDPFALVVADDTMMPRYEPGEKIYVAPNQRPGPGKDAIVITADNAAHLRRFVSMSPTTLVMSQLSPPLEIAFDRGDVVALHAVVGRG